MSLHVSCEMDAEALPIRMKQGPSCKRPQGPASVFPTTSFPRSLCNHCYSKQENYSSSHKTAATIWVPPIGIFQAFKNRFHLFCPSAKPIEWKDKNKAPYGGHIAPSFLINLILEHGVYFCGTVDFQKPTPGLDSSPSSQHCETEARSPSGLILSLQNNFWAAHPLQKSCLFHMETLQSRYSFSHFIGEECEEQRDWATPPKSHRLLSQNISHIMSEWVSSHPWLLAVSLRGGSCLGESSFFWFLHRGEFL